MWCGVGGVIVLIITAMLAGFFGSRNCEGAIYLAGG